MYALLFLLQALPTWGLPQGGPGAAWNIGQPVKTTSGTVTGHEASWPADSGVSEYLGIPYGKAPVDELRFMPPVRFEGSGQIPGDKWVS